MAKKEKIYFASDFHLGTQGKLPSKERERLIVQWLDEIKEDATALYLVGDIFDYWFEYKQVIPRGFSLFLGKIAELRSGGLPIYFFIGNHDMWMFDYFPEEYGIPVYRAPIQKEIQGKKLFIGHGDGLGPNDLGYKVVKKIFNNPFCQWCYARIHPNLALAVMRMTSKKSRDADKTDGGFLGVEKEMLIQYSEQKSKVIEVDYLIFGHRHLPMKIQLSNKKSTYFGLGDWLYHQSYGVLENGEFRIEYFKEEDKTVEVSL